MSLFQCQNCGCADNTSLTYHGFNMWFVDDYDWTGIEERKGKKLCSACGPLKFKSGALTEKGGKWHNAFPRIFLPLGMFKTNSKGNLEHIETGSTRYYEYGIQQGEQHAD